MTATPRSRNSYLSRPATSSRSEGVSIADFPKLPRSNTEVIQTQASAARAANLPEQSRELVGELIGNGVSQAFCARQLDHILEDNPELRPQLSLVKKSIRDHESDLATILSDKERAFNEKMVAEMAKNENLQREVKKQTLNVKHRFDMLMFCYKKDDIRLKEIAELTQNLDSATASNKDQGETIRQLQATIEDLQTKLSLVQREQQCERNLHSAERKMFIQAYRDFALKLESEAMKSRPSQADDDTLPMLYNNGLKKNFDIYRAFYIQQQQLYHSFFGGGEGEKHAAPEKMVASTDDGDRFRSSEYFDHRTSLFSKFRTESDLLRDAYLESASRLELHNLRSRNSPPFLSDEFVAWMALNPKLSKENHDKKHHQETKENSGNKAGSSSEHNYVQEARESLREEVEKKFHFELSEELSEDSDADD
ncbi:hypothetical protein BJ875DRAFT_453649, partial [Amylocarpus encephaloides]